tara:strand:+ start:11573 stop:11917 length:345 start_codon:yes stop_codon:yes gene_type:complete
MKLIRCDRTQYLKRCNTDKAYAVQYSKYGNGNIMFLSKKYVKLEAEPCEDDSTTIYYWFEIPDWLYEKMSDENKQDISLFDKDASQRIYEHDAQTKPKKWYSNKETDNLLRPFG